MPYINNYQADVRVSIDGKPYFESWATYSGGDISASNSKTRPGGMGKEVDVGGQGTRSDATLTHQWTERVLGKVKEIQSRIGKGDVKISINWLDNEGQRLPDAVFTKRGVLKGANEPAYDHNGNAVGMFTIVVGLDEEGA